MPLLRGITVALGLDGMPLFQRFYGNKRKVSVTLVACHCCRVLAGICCWNQRVSGMPLIVWQYRLHATRNKARLVCQLVACTEYCNPELCQKWLHATTKLKFVFFLHNLPLQATRISKSRFRNIACFGKGIRKKRCILEKRSLKHDVIFWT